jgi:p-aminobenzoyl-glutamate transporter AbgT
MKSPGTKFDLSAQNIVNGAMTANITSDIADVSAIPHIAMQFDWTGAAPVGNLLVQASLQGPESSVVNFGTIDTIAISGNSGTVVRSYSFTAYRQFRLFYSFGSGTGTAQGYIVGKS